MLNRATRLSGALRGHLRLSGATGSHGGTGYIYMQRQERSNNAARSKEGSNKVESKYSKTVLLLNTSFSQRANSAVKEPQIQQWWKDHNIYEKLYTQNTGSIFTLHDGPPYANGELHIGHALNKVLKDFINRYQILRGKKVKFVPGWDTHGLPIELKVLQSMKQNEREKLTPITLRKLATSFAKETMSKQRDAFERYGVWADWKSPYLTLQPEYEAAQIKVFGEMVAKGHIYRGKRPVHWSPSSRTALAEAELEYPENHVSKSIYLGFQCTQLSASLKELIGGSAEDVRVTVWTTTPWTVPANAAVAVNPELDYCIASHPAVQSGAKFLVATALAPSLSTKLGLDAEKGDALVVEKIFKGSVLIGCKYQHPLYARESEIIEGGDYITTASGTGLVHTAPGHGAEDYKVGLAYGLPLLSPVNDMGCFTEEAGPRFAGLDVLGSGNTEVITALEETGCLLKAEDYAHKYPYDWRTKKPTIFRATEQWFASVSTFRENALSAINDVEWIPATGKNRIVSMTENRGDWCISRQRCWGVPIPAFYHLKTNEPLMTPETLSHIEHIFREKGSDSWWELSVEELLPDSMKHMAHLYSRGTDTMDVWFDSGTSWAGVLQERAAEGLNYPADLYLEGSDQHRGWFQSSLLTSVASQGIAPYKKVLTHGFVLDAKGHKMSKSVGNVVDPRKIIEGGSNQKVHPAYGADTLRLWISSVDYTGDVCVGDHIIKQASESYRKLRNTLRYLVGSLSGFDPAKDAVPLHELASIDRYVLGRLSKTVQEVQLAYDEHQFYKANNALVAFASTTLSAFYLDISKDRLYVSSVADKRRYKKVLTHGFVLDAKGHKMSKSVGNVVDPRKIIEGGSNQKVHPAYGADTLRLWISSVDYTGDVCVGDHIIKQASESYRKLRNTLRYLVGSLSGFDPAKDAVPLHELASIDRYVLGRLSKTVQEVQLAYDEHQFYKANNALVAFASTTLSAFYLDISKDRLYVSSVADKRRASCQTVLHHVLEQLAVLMAPLVPHMSEDLWQNLPYTPSHESVFEKGWPDSRASSSSSSSSASYFPLHDEDKWELVRKVRDDVNKVIETKRTAKLVGASQECRVVLFASDAETKKMLSDMQGDAEMLCTAEKTNGCDDLRFVLIASQVTVVDTREDFMAACGGCGGDDVSDAYASASYTVSDAESESGLLIGVARAEGHKCQRCWFYCTSVGLDSGLPDVCRRCADVIRTDGHDV